MITPAVLDSCYKGCRLRASALGFLFVFVIPIVAACLYWPGLSGAFLLDDKHNIGPLIANDVFSWQQLWFVLSHNTSGLLGRSISVLSLHVTSLLHGGDAWFFKYHNLLIHLLNYLLLCWLLALVAKQTALASRAWLLAFMVASLWLLEPIQVSTVLYAVQRMAQLATLFTLCGLLVLVFGLKQLQQGRLSIAAVFLYLGFPLCLALAALSKENGVLLPLYALCLLPFWSVSQNNAKTAWRLRAGFITIFIVIPLILGGLYLLLRFDSLTNYSNRNFTLQERLLTQPGILWFYIKLHLFPRVSDMSLYHDGLVLNSHLNGRALFAIAGLLLSLLTAWLVRKRHPLITLGIAWFFVGHLLESTLLPLEMVFEHRNYLAGVGLVLVMVYLILLLPIVLSLRLFIFALLLSMFGFMTHLRADIWSNTLLLHHLAVENHPTSSRARSTYAYLLLEIDQVEAAREQLVVASELNHQDAGPVLNLLMTYCYEKVMPEFLFEQSGQRLAQYPVSAYGLSGLNVLGQRQHYDQCPALDIARLHQLLEQAINGDNDGPNAGYLYWLKAQTSIVSGDYDAAERWFDKAFIKMKVSDPLMEMLDFQIGSGRLNSAEKTLQRLRLMDRFGYDEYKLNQLESHLKNSEQRVTNVSQ